MPMRDGHSVGRTSYQRHHRRMRRQENAAIGCFGVTALFSLLYTLVVIGIVVGVFVLVWKAVLG